MNFYNVLIIEIKMDANDYVGVDVYGEEIAYEDYGYSVSSDAMVHLIVNVNWYDDCDDKMYCVSIRDKDIKNLLYVLDSEQNEGKMAYDIVHLPNVTNCTTPSYKVLELDTITDHVFSSTDFLHDLVKAHMGFTIDRVPRIHKFNNGYLTRETVELED